MTTDKKSYFDEDGKQLRALPSKWIDLKKRFKPGDTIRWLRDDHIYVGPRDKHGHSPGGAVPPDQVKSLKGQLGEVLRVNDGRRIYPAQWFHEESECWMTDSPGWLTVRMPFDHYGFEEDGSMKPRACRPDSEGVDWEKVSK